MNSQQFNNKHIVVNDALIEEGEIYSIIEPVWWTGDIYDNVERYEKSLESFSTEQRLIFASMWYMSEVNNGGHDQFYYNSTGIVWPDALKGFEVLGLSEVVSIIKESVERMGGNPSRDREARYDQLNSCEEGFSDLDDKFYDFENNVNIDDVMLKYVKLHRDKFYFDGHVSVLE